MASRLELQTLLEDILGNNNVYYQPPESVKISYPAVIYKLSKINKKTADNACYSTSTTYQITLIYRDADSNLPMKMATLDRCYHTQHYTSDGLYHDVFIKEF